MSRFATFAFFCFFSIAALLPGADTSWARVKDLKSRSELRIYKKGAREPITAAFDDANDDRIVVVIKNDQTAIQKEDIDRIDARPLRTPRKVSVDSVTKQTDPDLVPHPNAAPAVPGTSSSSNVSFGGGEKGKFETIYLRTDGSSKK